MNRISTILLFACVFISSSCIKEPEFDQIKYVNTLDANIDVKKVSLNGEYCVEDNGYKNTWECAFKVGFDSLLKDSWFVRSSFSSDDFYKNKPTNNNGQFFVEIVPDVYDTTYYYCAFLRKGDKELAEGEVKAIYFGNPDATIVTIPVSDITESSAACGGIVNNSGNTSVTARGVCWSTSHNPTINGSHTTDGSGTGNFTSTMTGLSPNTTYYVRAYATNSAGTVYGEEREFATIPGLPTVTTSTVSNITTNSATCGGNVTNDGNATVTARGLCWSTSHNPTISSSHTTNGSGTGSFTSSITGLSENTTYYVRAYATNSAGTAYGEERTFKTVTLPTVTTSTVSSITTSSAICGGYVTNDGNTTVTARGICWSTSHNPTISNSHTTNGSGTGSFTSSITGLSENTTYYVRAYATNSVGTAYGEEKTFTASSVGGFDQNGASNAVFTVASSGRTVHFSRGNLQYRASTGTWRFAEHQYDYVGSTNSNISSSYSGWIDLFGWGTSGWNSGATAYQPWATSTTISDYYLGGSYTNNLTGTYANADWGVYNAISNGGNQAGMWRTLTKDEWSYLLNGRTASTINGVANARYAKAVVNGVKGLVLFPDNFTMPSGMSYPTGINSSSASYSSNTYTESQWSQMEDASCVFLPAAGYRYGTGVGNVGTYGYYWSSTCTYCGDLDAEAINFYDDNLSVVSTQRARGRSVRLVRD